mgnify:CR=1 FL=1
MPHFLAGLTGSFAQKADENPTVAMVQAAYDAAGLDVRYINCEVAPEGLADAVRGAVAMGWLGFNCSLPHKVAVIDLLDELAPSAAVIGAVNTVVHRDGRLIGENTDGRGFVEAMLAQADPTGQRVLLFGAGGAARAIAVETALAGAAHITVVNRDAGRGRELADLVNARTPASAEYRPWDRDIDVPEGTGIVINATSIGFYPDVDARLALNVDTLRPGMVVADVITNPPTTRLIRDARERGCIAIDGLGMLVNQALVAVQLWTGKSVDGAVMRRVLEDLFGSPA